MRLRAVSSWLLASLVGVAAHASAQGDLSAKGIARAVAAAEALGARTGVAVCDAGGRWLFRHAAGDAFAPASNMKVLTAAAVVNGLGADFHFTTTFALRGGRLVRDDAFAVGVRRQRLDGWYGLPHSDDSVA